MTNQQAAKKLEKAISLNLRAHKNYCSAMAGSGTTKTSRTTLERADRMADEADRLFAEVLAHLKGA